MPLLFLDIIIDNWICLVIIGIKQIGYSNCTHTIALDRLLTPPVFGVDREGGIGRLENLFEFNFRADRWFYGDRS